MERKKGDARETKNGTVKTIRTKVGGKDVDPTAREEVLAWLTFAFHFGKSSAK